ncbi:hypothetical protein [Planobispora longispora]|uniref:hypothetical protein n=1 Tax=Planobispora longispora TaxID=28887 RepID=UPI00361483DC
MAFATGASGSRSAVRGGAASAAETGAGRAGGPAGFTNGTAAADTVNSSRTAVTSRLASAWVPPERGTLAGMPTRRSPA